MTNRLAAATSPYLQQHADNPVDWYPWGEESLARARAENKPILLSIGYSACHWCHVMAHESFEDAAVAAVMNDAFVNIKVDREERPDLDQIYQTAHALLTRRSGGWPLTMFLTPEGAPFFGGTYFPKHGRYGLPGFLELLPKVAGAYREQGDRLAEQNRRLAEALTSARARGRRCAAAGGGSCDRAGRTQAHVSIPCTAASAARPSSRTRRSSNSACARRAIAGDQEALAIVRVRRSTAWPMAASTTSWAGASAATRSTPNGPFRISRKCSTTTARCSRCTRTLRASPAERRYADVARDIVGWLVREMQADDGAFYSSLDADSEGVRRQVLRMDARGRRARR